MCLLGLDEILHKIGLLGIKVGVLPLEAADQRLEGDTCDVNEIRRPDSDHGILVEPVVEGGHLADSHEVVEGFIGGLDAPVEIGSVLQVSKATTKGDSSEEVPSVFFVLANKSRYQAVEVVGLKPTERNPLSQVAVLRTRRPSDKSLFELLAKVGNDTVHRRLRRQDTPNGVVLDNRPLHSGVLRLIRRAEHVVDNLSIDKGTVVMIHLGLAMVSINFPESFVSGFLQIRAYLEPFSISAIYCLNQLGIVDVEKVGPGTNHRAVLFVQLLDCQLVILPSLDQEESPQVRPSCQKDVLERCVKKTY